MNEDTESFTRVEELASSKKCKKEHAVVKQKLVSLKKVNQAEIMGAKLDVVRDMLDVLNKRLASMNDEKQDDENGLFGKLAAAELKSLRQRLIIMSKVQTKFDISC